MITIMRGYEVVILLRCLFPIESLNAVATAFNDSLKQRKEEVRR